MEIQLDDKGDIKILQIIGSLNINCHLDFYDFFLSQLKEPFKKICIDFEKVDSIDSSGISILVRCEGEAKKRDREMILFGISDNIIENLKNVRLIGFFNIKTREEFQKDILDG
jgi:anti-anti-sigma factor